MYTFYIHVRIKGNFFHWVFVSFIRFLKLFIIKFFFYNSTSRKKSIRHGIVESEWELFRIVCSNNGYFLNLGNPKNFMSCSRVKALNFMVEWNLKFLNFKVVFVVKNNSHKLHIICPSSFNFKQLSSNI